MKKYLTIVLLISFALITGCGESDSRDSLKLTVDSIHFEGTVTDNFAVSPSVLAAGNAATVSAGTFNVDVNTALWWNFQIKAEDAASPKNKTVKNVAIK